MHEFRNPRCCQVVRLGLGQGHRYVLEVGHRYPEVVAEITAEMTGELATALDGALGTAGGDTATRLPLPPRATTFRIGALRVTEEGEGIEVLAWADSPEEHPLDPGQATLRCLLAAPAARSLAASCRESLAQRTVTCPFCGLTLEPDGHICPRANGYRR